MDPLHLCIALGPLAVYFLVLGLLNLSRYPFLTTGARDLGALGVAVSGLAVAGPMELFFPETAAARFGGFAWVLLLAMYGLLVLLVCLLARPRLVIYNLGETELREVLARLLPQIDKHAQVTGDTLLLPTLGVQAHIEPFASLRNVQVVASGPRQSYAGWQQFELQLALALREIRVAPNPYGVTLLLFAGVMTVLVAAFMAGSPQAVAQALRDMMRW
jgi:hypothetical protein